MSIIMKWYSLVFSRDFLSKREKNEGSTINRGHFATEKGAQMQNSIYSVENCMEFLFISVTSTLTTQKYYMSMVWVMSLVLNHAARRTGRVRGTAKVRYAFMNSNR